MKKTATVLSWVMLGLFGIAFLGLGVQYPGAVSGGSLLILLPYAAALLAFKAKPNQALIGGSIFLNALMVVVGVVYASFGAFVGESVKVFLVALFLLPPPLLNCVVLTWAWDRSRAVTNDANKRLQATREARAPEA